MERSQQPLQSSRRSSFFQKEWFNLVLGNHCWGQWQPLVQFPPTSVQLHKSAASFQCTTTAIFLLLLSLRQPWNARNNSPLFSPLCLHRSIKSNTLNVTRTRNSSSPLLVLPTWCSLSSLTRGSDEGDRNVSLPEMRRGFRVSFFCPGQKYAMGSCVEAEEVLEISLRGWLDCE